MIYRMKCNNFISIDDNNKHGDKEKWHSTLTFAQWFWSAFPSSLRLPHSHFFYCLSELALQLLVYHKVGNWMRLNFPCWKNSSSFRRRHHAIIIPKMQMNFNLTFSLSLSRQRAKVRVDSTVNIFYFCRIKHVLFKSNPTSLLNAKQRQHQVKFAKIRKIFMNLPGKLNMWVKWSTTMTFHRNKRVKEKKSWVEVTFRRHIMERCFFLWGARKAN